MASAANANYRTIGEVANELGIEPHTLRFWEKEFSSIHPVKRKGNRRFYSDEDIATLSEIRTLLHSEGYTIKGAKMAMKQKKEPKAADTRQTDIFDVLAQPTFEEKQVMSKLLENLKEIKKVLAEPAA